MSIPAEDRVAELRRWELFGGTWRTLCRTRTAGTVALCRCDGGEEVEQITSSDPRFLALLDQAQRNGGPGQQRADVPHD